MKSKTLIYDPFLHTNLQLSVALFLLSLAVSEGKIYHFYIKGPQPMILIIGIHETYHYAQ